MNKWKHKRSVRYRYDKTAQSYDHRYCNEQEAKYQAALDGLAVTSHSIVLDVGCGTGLFFDRIADKANKVVGLDLSRELLFKSKSRAKACDNVFVISGDADFLPFVDGFFDFVFAFTVLQNMPKPVEMLRELSRVVKPESTIVATALKRAISLEAFADMLEQTGLRATELREDEQLQCYVVTAAQSAKSPIIDELIDKGERRNDAFMARTFRPLVKR